MIFTRLATLQKLEALTLALPTFLTLTTWSEQLKITS